MSAGIMLLGMLAGLVAGGFSLACGYGILVSFGVYSAAGALSILVLGVGAFMAGRLPQAGSRQEKRGLTETAPARRRHAETEAH